MYKITIYTKSFNHEFVIETQDDYDVDNKNNLIVNDISGIRYTVNQNHWQEIKVEFSD